jgi:hypothetical protein
MIDIEERISYLPRWLSLSGNASFHGGAVTAPIELYGDDGMCVSGPVKVQGMKVRLCISESGIGGFADFGTRIHPNGNMGLMLRRISSVIHDGT